MASEVMNEDVRTGKLKKTRESSKELSVEGRVMKLEFVITEVPGMAEDAGA